MTMIAPGVSGQLFLEVNMAANQEWYTPVWVLNLVEETLGRIDLDPCSNAYATVPALRHYIGSSGMDGLSLDWGEKECIIQAGAPLMKYRDPFTVFANPPWCEPHKWTHKAKTAYLEGQFSECIMLLPARTGTKWFQDMKGFPVCFPKGRVKYEQMSDEGDLFTPKNGGFEDSCFFYIGDRPERFDQIFSRIGLVFMPGAQESAA